MVWIAWGPAAVATVLLLGVASPLPAASLQVKYDISVRISPADHVLSGTVRVLITNQSENPLREVPFLLYPNIYREPNRDLNKDALGRIYPREFNPGSMAVTSIKTEAGDPVAFDIGTTSPDTPQTVARAILPHAVPPNGSIELRLTFITFIPEKYGVFGHFRNVTALKGGWYPYVAAFRDGAWALDTLPDPAEFVVQILAPRDVTIVGAEMADDDAGAPHRRWRLHMPRAVNVALAMSPYYQERVEQHDSIRIRYAFLPHDRAYTPPVLAALRRGLTFFRSQFGDPALAEIRVAEVYLHQEVVSPDPSVIFVATRTYKVFAPLKKYHEAEVVKGLFFALWRGRLPDEEAWVIEGLADATTQAYLRQRFRRPPNLLGLLKPIAFIPVIDQILYSNRLPLRQVYFKETTPIVPREDFAVFNNRRPDGSSIFFKLSALIGTDAVNTVLEQYTDLVTRGSPRPFRAVAQEATGRDLEWFYRQWLTTNPSTDFSVASVQRETRTDGHHTTLTLAKTGDGIEPVAIRLRLGEGPPLATTWLSFGSEFQETFVTRSPVKVIELDPDHKTSDPDRYNNRTPPAVKFILESLPGISYDFQTKNISYDVSAYFQRRYDEHNILRLRYSKDDIETQGGVAATHDFEQPVFSYTTRQSVSAGVEASRRAIPITPGEPPETVTSVQLSHVVSNAQTPIVYSEDIQNIFFGAIPYSSLTTMFAQRVSGGEYPSALKLQLDARHQWSFATLHEIAVRGTIGQSAGGFHDARQFDLAGAGGMRGYSPGSLSGESVLLASLEYRHPLVREIGANIWGLTLLRRLQAAVFTDTGTVGSPRNFADFLSDVGVGLRLTHEVLGLYPIVTRLDVAWPINVDEELRAEEQEPHFYLTAGQPF
jgi:hypothetical protein